MKGFLKIATLFGIGGVVCLLIFALREPQAQDKPTGDVIATKTELSSAKQKALKEEAAKRKAVVQQRVARARQRQASRKVDFGENAAFYQLIIDNNLFRPLGWQKQNDEPSYSLLGTVVDTDTAIAQAILLEKRSNRHYFVTVGEKVGDATVKEIQAKQVILDEAGKAITLKAGSLQFLTHPRDGGRGAEARASETAKGNEGEKAAANAKKATANANQRANRFGMDPELAEKWRNASPENRRKIEEYMRNQRNQRREQRESTRRENRGDRGGRRARGSRGDSRRDR